MDEPIIVGFSQINRAIAPKQSEVMQRTHEALAQETDPLEATKFLTAIGLALRELEKRELHPEVLSTSEHPIASGLQSYIASKAAETGKIEALPIGYEVKMDDNDWLGWARSFFTWWRRIKPHDLLPPAPPEAMPKEFVMALAGDWGSGLYGAPVCGKSIEKNTYGYTHLMHLGDVYYSGTEDEVRNRFLRYWPRVPNAKNYALNANHEMYTGGHAYFELALKDGRFGQPSSFFVLENSDFVLIGMDTAYKEHDLAEEELPWLGSVLAGAGSRKVILFSHHQPFSRFDNQGTKLQEKLAAALAGRQIFAWYWGHEHRAILYDQHPTWGLYGRCVGNGGYPYFRKDVAHLPPAGQRPGWRRLDGQALVPGGLLLDKPNPYVRDSANDPERYGVHGYMTLLFSGSRLTELVHDADGRVVYEGELK